MPGYILVEQKSLTPPMPPGRGLTANQTRIGFADFLRELESDTFPYDENSSLLVVGLEDILIGSRPDMEGMAKMIHAKLQRAAGPFNDRNCGFVQIAFRRPLKRGDRLVVDHEVGELPIYLIFGSPPDEDINGIKIFRRDFNLSSLT